jgi:hypothetical protein
MHPVGADEHARRFLELPVRGERHPEGAQVVRSRVGSVKGHIGAPHMDPWGPGRAVRALSTSRQGHFLFDQTVKTTLAEAL